MFKQFKPNFLHEIPMSSTVLSPRPFCPPPPAQPETPSQRPGEGSADRAPLPAARRRGLQDAPSTWNLREDVGRSG